MDPAPQSPPSEPSQPRGTRAPSTEALTRLEAELAELEAELAALDAGEGDGGRRASGGAA